MWLNYSGGLWLSGPCNSIQSRAQAGGMFLL